MKRVKGAKYMIMEGDQTLDGEHTTQYTDIVLYNYISENYIMLLTNVIPNKFN